MKRYKMIVLTNAHEGRDADLREWFDKVHLREMLDIPGCVSAQRLDLAPIDSIPSPQWRHAALYTIEADDPAKFNAEMFRRYVEGEMTPCDALHQISYNGIFSDDGPVLVRQ